MSSRLHHHEGDNAPLLGGGSPSGGLSYSDNYGGTASGGGDHDIEQSRITAANRGWSFQEGRRSTATRTTATAASTGVVPNSTSPNRKGSIGSETDDPSNSQKPSSSKNDGTNARFLYYVIYALVNVIISAPGLYGYAAVIFNNPIFDTHMNALSKLVIFSSLIHQLGFLLFSNLKNQCNEIRKPNTLFYMLFRSV